MCGMYNELSVA